MLLNYQSEMSPKIRRWRSSCRNEREDSKKELFFNLSLFS